MAPGDLHWHEPLARVEVNDAGSWRPARRDGQVVDDEGWDLQVTHLGGPGGEPGRGDGHRYALRWWNPTLGAPRRHRFVLAANAAQPEWASEAFG